MKDFKTFFNDYAKASLSSDTAQVAHFYAENFIAASGDQTQSFKNDDKFRKWLEDVFKFNRKSGMQSMTVKTASAEKFGKNSFRVTVAWTVKFEKKPDNPLDFDIHYILQEVSGEPKIVLYISDEDQEELMKSNGILSE